MVKKLAEYFVEGKPVPYKGTLTSSRSGRYVPPEVRAWQAQIAAHTINAMRGEAPSEGRIRLELDFYMPTYRRTDLDNHAKSCLDAIKGIAFNDDDQVIELHLNKHYCPESDGLPPGILITITELEPTHRTRQDYYAKRRKAK